MHDLKLKSSFAIAVLTLAGLQLACAASSHPVTTPFATADSIPESAIQQEMRSVHTGAGYPILFLLIGGSAGAVVGCRVGAAVAPDAADDYAPCLLGAFGGLVAGIAGGLVVGVNLAEKTRRDEAIRRIRARRSQKP